MKINRFNGSKGEIINSVTQIIRKLGYFVILTLKIIAGITIAIVLVLLIANTLFKKEVQSIDDYFTHFMFYEMVDNRNYHNAIFLMESKPRLMNESPMATAYKVSLSDCYKSIGQYGKAEKLLLDVYENPFQNVDNRFLKDTLKPDVQPVLKVLRFNFAYSLADIYEKIGDDNNVRRYFGEMKKMYDDTSINMMDSLVKNSNISWRTLFNKFNIKDIYQELKIRIDYMDNPRIAMKQMAQFANTIEDPQFKIDCYNRLIKWEMEQNRLFDAYKTIHAASSYVLSYPSTTPAKHYGVLADYCYMMHDMDRYRKLVTLYEAYLKKHYHKTDLVYLQNNVRKMRILESKGDWDEIEDMLVETCAGMKNTIQENFLTMGEEQREYFSENLQMPFEYAKHVLTKHPSAVVARLVMDNAIFQKGLLLRSSLSVRQAVSHSGDKNMVVLYDSLTNLRRELLVRTSSYKLLNIARNIELQREISSLDRQLSQVSGEYSASKKDVSYSSEAIQEKLGNNYAVVLLGEYNSKPDTLLYALVLKSQGDVDYIPLCNTKALKGYLGKNQMRLYTTPAVSDLLWSKVSRSIGSCVNIYYTTDGFFNSISVPTLLLANGHYLYQEKRLHLVSNPIEILNENRNHKLLTGKTHVSIWGGINYTLYRTPAEDVLDSTIGRFITRGDSLYNLPGSWKEVKGLSSMLSDHHIKNMVYTRDEATETTFKKRSGKGDAILHISTHGFFFDSPKEVEFNPLRSSGLLFAGANSYWINDSLYNQQKFLKSGDDGILRSDEIALLDFNGCELVVLSACQTGLGYNHSSEGVYGLQRAFKLAGAKRILMSMWSVSDFHTSLLMQSLYKHLIEGDDIETALSKSKNEVRKKYGSPLYWGGFVLLN